MDGREIKRGRFLPGTAERAVAEELGTPPGCHRAAARSGHVVSHLCATKDLVLHSPAPPCELRAKGFKARKLNSLLTGVSGYLGWKVVMVPLGHRGLGL